MIKTSEIPIKYYYLYVAAVLDGGTIVKNRFGSRGGRLIIIDALRAGHYCKNRFGSCAPSGPMRYVYFTVGVF